MDLYVPSLLIIVSYMIKWDKVTIMEVEALVVSFKMVGYLHQNDRYSSNYNCFCTAAHRNPNSGSIRTMKPEELSCSTWPQLPVRHTSSVVLLHLARFLLVAQGIHYVSINSKFFKCKHVCYRPIACNFGYKNAFSWWADAPQLTG